MTQEDAEKFVKVLSEKAANAPEHDAALKFSQAACNVANAMCALLSAKNSTS